MNTIFTQFCSTASKMLSFFLISLLTLSYSAIAHTNHSTTGEQSTLVILVNFQENSTEQPLTTAEANQLVFGEVNQFYQENSYGQTWLSGQVAGWYTLPVSNNVCNYANVQAAADEAATADGIVLADYARIIYLMTKTACADEGMATMEGAPSRAYINGIFTSRLIAHELGHNFGLRHSHALDCGDQTLADNCTSKEYGDTYDVMGKPDIGYFNTFQKEQLGWLDGEHATAVNLVSQNGTYTIAQYETQNTTQPVTLKIPRGTDPQSGLMSYFYIEYRQAVGFDSFLANRSYTYFRGDVTDGIIVRIGNEGDSNSSYLLHLNTASQYKEVYGRNDWYDPALQVGKSYTDPQSGVSFTLVSAANGTAEVNVSFDRATDTTDTANCEVHLPSVSATPATTAEADAGEQISYLVTVTNHDSESCAASSFDVSANPASGWTTTSQTVSLASGETTQVMIAVTSADNAAAGTYSFNIGATHTSEGMTALTGTNYTVLEAQSEVQAPTAINDNATITAKVAVNVNVLANDLLPQPEMVSIVSFTQGSKGSVRLSNGELVYTPGKRFKTNDSFTYTISNGTSTSTATVSVTLVESTTDTDSGGNTSKPPKGNRK